MHLPQMFLATKTYKLVLRDSTTIKEHDVGSYFALVTGVNKIQNLIQFQT